MTDACGFLNIHKDGVDSDTRFVLKTGKITVGSDVDATIKHECKNILGVYFVIHVDVNGVATVAAETTSLRTSLNGKVLRKSNLLILRPNDILTTPGLTITYQNDNFNIEKYKEKLDVVTKNKFILKTPQLNRMKIVTSAELKTSGKKTGPIAKRRASEMLLNLQSRGILEELGPISTPTPEVTKPLKSSSAKARKSRSVSMSENISPNIASHTNLSVIGSNLIPPRRTSQRVPKPILMKDFDMSTGSDLGEEGTENWELFPNAVQNSILGVKNVTTRDKSKYNLVQNTTNDSQINSYDVLDSTDSSSFAYQDCRSTSRITECSNLIRFSTDFIKKSSELITKDDLSVSGIEKLPQTPLNASINVERSFVKHRKIISEHPCIDLITPDNKSNCSINSNLSLHSKQLFSCPEEFTLIEEDEPIEDSTAFITPKIPCKSNKKLSLFPTDDECWDSDTSDLLYSNRTRKQTSSQQRAHNNTQPEHLLSDVANENADDLDSDIMPLSTPKCKYSNYNATGSIEKSLISETKPSQTDFSNSRHTENQLKKFKLVDETKTFCASKPLRTSTPWKIKPNEHLSSKLRKEMQKGSLVSDLKEEIDLEDTSARKENSDSESSDSEENSEKNSAILSLKNIDSSKCNDLQEESYLEETLNSEESSDSESSNSVLDENPEFEELDEHKLSENRTSHINIEKKLPTKEQKSMEESSAILKTPENKLISFMLETPVDKKLHMKSDIEQQKFRKILGNKSDFEMIDQSLEVCKLSESCENDTIISTSLEIATPKVSTTGYETVDESEVNRRESINYAGSKYTSTPKPQKTPKNDCQGVKQLLVTSSKKLQKLPENDLRNLSGVKNLMKAPSVELTPTTNLSDIEGVKQLINIPCVQTYDDLKTMTTPGVHFELSNSDIGKSSRVVNFMETSKFQKTPKCNLSNVGDLYQLFKTPAAKNLPNNELSVLREPDYVNQLQEIEALQDSSENELINLRRSDQLTVFSEPIDNNVMNINETQVLFESSMMQPKSTKKSPKMLKMPKHDLPCSTDKKLGFEKKRSGNYCKSAVREVKFNLESPMEVQKLPTSEFSTILKTSQNDLTVIDDMYESQGIQPPENCVTDLPTDQPQPLRKSSGIIKTLKRDLRNSVEENQILIPSDSSYIIEPKQIIELSLKERQSTNKTLIIDTTEVGGAKQKSEKLAQTPSNFESSDFIQFQKIIECSNQPTSVKKSRGRFSTLKSNLFDARYVEQMSETSIMKESPRKSFRNTSSDLNGIDDNGVLPEISILMESPRKSIRNTSSVLKTPNDLNDTDDNEVIVESPVDEESINNDLKDITGSNIVTTSSSKKLSLRRCSLLATSNIANDLVGNDVQLETPHDSISNENDLDEAINVNRLTELSDKQQKSTNKISNILKTPNNDSYLSEKLIEGNLKNVTLELSSNQQSSSRKVLSVSEKYMQDVDGAELQYEEPVESKNHEKSINTDSNDITGSNLVMKSLTKKLSFERCSPLTASKIVHDAVGDNVHLKTPHDSSSTENKKPFSNLLQISEHNSDFEECVTSETCTKDLDSTELTKATESAKKQQAISNNVMTPKNNTQDFDDLTHIETPVIQKLTNDVADADLLEISSAKQRKSNTLKTPKNYSVFDQQLIESNSKNVNLNSSTKQQESIVKTFSAIKTPIKNMNEFDGTKMQYEGSVNKLSENDDRDAGLAIASSQKQQKSIRESSGILETCKNNFDFNDVSESVAIEPVTKRSIRKISSTVKIPNNSLQDFDGAIAVDPYTVNQFKETSKSVTRTPRVYTTRKSDLTDVLNLKPLKEELALQTPSDFNLREYPEFAGSITSRIQLSSIGRTPWPTKATRNNLANIDCVQQLFKDSPNMDIHDVPYANQLLRASRKNQNSPKNDLSYFKGVKRLLKTPRVQKKPLNDLSDLRGVKTLLKTPSVQVSPKNDLRYVRGLKSLMKTPRLQKTPVNDLSDVDGVKQLLKTPIIHIPHKNDLSNFKGVKRLLKTPRVQKKPLNDLSDLRGVKTLLKTPSDQVSPKNDLRDVQGLKSLMKTPRLQKTPVNDLSNVDGVKQLLKTPIMQISPKNDLSDVRGVKQLFTSSRKRQRSPENDLSNVAGVKKLFRTPLLQGASINESDEVRPSSSKSNISGIAEKSFDELINKKYVKTYPGKSSITKSDSPSQKLYRPELDNSVSSSTVTSPYVEQWIESVSAENNEKRSRQISKESNSSERIISSIRNDRRVLIVKLVRLPLPRTPFIIEKKRTRKRAAQSNITKSTIKDKDTINSSNKKDSSEMELKGITYFPPTDSYKAHDKHLTKKRAVRTKRSAESGNNETFSNKINHNKQNKSDVYNIQKQGTPRKKTGDSNTQILEKKELSKRKKAEISSSEKYTTRTTTDLLKEEKAKKKPNKVTGDQKKNVKVQSPLVAQKRSARNKKNVESDIASKMSHDVDKMINPRANPIQEIKKEVKKAAVTQIKNLKVQSPTAPKRSLRNKQNVDTAKMKLHIDQMINGHSNLIKETPITKNVKRFVTNKQTAKSDKNTTKLNNEENIIKEEQDAKGKRHAKNKQIVESYNTTSRESQTEKKAVDQNRKAEVTPKRRGRKRKVQIIEETTDIVQNAKGKRLAKQTVDSDKTTSNEIEAKIEKKANKVTVDQNKKTEVTPKRRGRKRKVQVIEETTDNVQTVLPMKTRNKNKVQKSISVKDTKITENVKVEVTKKENKLPVRVTRAQRSYNHHTKIH